jgi:hypothetical protein
MRPKPWLWAFISSVMDAANNTWRPVKTASPATWNRA